MIGPITERLQKKFDAGEIGFLGVIASKSKIYVAPTYLITDPRELDKFAEGLLPNLKPIYHRTSEGADLYMGKGLSYPLLRFRGGSVWVLPDYQLAENISGYDEGMGVKYPFSQPFEGYTRGLNKRQLAALMKNPLGFNQKLKADIESIKRNPPDFSFIPPEGFRRTVIPGLRLI